jgi:hypothetical protein
MAVLTFEVTTPSELLKVPGHAKAWRYFSDYRTRRRCVVPSASRGVWHPPGTVLFPRAVCRAPSPSSPADAGKGEPNNVSRGSAAKTERADREARVENQHPGARQRPA